MRRLSLLIALATPVFADLRLFHEIREKDRITLVLPGGSCQASVVARDLQGISVKLHRTTAACGLRKSMAKVSRVDVLDVVGDRGVSGSAPGMSRSAHCALLAATITAVTAGFAIGARTGSSLGLVPVVAAGGGAAFLCRSRGSRYTVFSERIVQ